MQKRPAGAPKRARLPHEYWDQLEAARSQKRICLERVNELKATCAARCGKPHISKCLDCYSDVLDAMRQRYRESRGREWFEQRSTFLNSLDSLFSEAMEQQTDPSSVETWVAEQKKTWYRAELALLEKMLAVAAEGGGGSSSSSGVAATLPPFPQAEFQRLTRGGSVDELGNLVWRTAGRPESWWAHPAQIRSRLRARGGSCSATDGTEPKHVYVDILFRDRATGDMSEDAKAWADAYLADDRLRLADVMAQMAQAHEMWKARAPQRESCRRRLDELRRAAAAVTQKKKTLSSKGSMAGDARRNRVASHLENLPPCAACKMSVGAAQVISCAICQVFVELGVQTTMTVYCTRGCFDEVQNSHAQQAHDCEAGDHCVAMADDVAKESSAAADVASEPALCTECVKSLGRPAIYCSQRCAGQHFQRHREAVHLPARAKAVREIHEQATATATTQGQGQGQEQEQEQEQGQEQEYKQGQEQEHKQEQGQEQGHEHKQGYSQENAPIDDSAQLVYENENKTNYHAADIGALVMRLGDTLERVFREEHPGATFLGIE